MYPVATLRLSLRPLCTCESLNMQSVLIRDNAKSNKTRFHEKSCFFTKTDCPLLLNNNRPSIKTADFRPQLWKSWIFGSKPQHLLDFVPWQFEASLSITIKNSRENEISFCQYKSYWKDRISKNNFSDFLNYISWKQNTCLLFFYNSTSTNLKRNKMSHYFLFLTGPVLIFKNELRCILVPKSEKKEKSIHTVVLLS